MSTDSIQDSGEYTMLETVSVLMFDHKHTTNRNQYSIHPNHTYSEK